MLKLLNPSLEPSVLILNDPVFLLKFLASSHQSVIDDVEPLLKPRERMRIELGKLECHPVDLALYSSQLVNHFSVCELLHHHVLTLRLVTRRGIAWQRGFDDRHSRFNASVPEAMKHPLVHLVE